MWSFEFCLDPLPTAQMGEKSQSNSMWFSIAIHNSHQSEYPHSNRLTFPLWVQDESYQRNIKNVHHAYLHEWLVHVCTHAPKVKNDLGRQTHTHTHVYMYIFFFNLQNYSWAFQGACDQIRIHVWLKHDLFHCWCHLLNETSIVMEQAVVIYSSYYVITMYSLCHYHGSGKSHIRTVCSVAQAQYQDQEPPAAVALC